MAGGAVTPANTVRWKRMRAPNRSSAVAEKRSQRVVRRRCASEALPAAGCRPAGGEGAAFISFGPTTLIAKSDPITFATDRIGWYAIQVNANDIAASGGTPRWFLATLLLPEDEPASTAQEIFRQLHRAADELGITLIGGHTEVTAGLPRPIIAGTMLGEAAPSETVRTSSAAPGDDVILTTGIATEGSAIIARESKSQLTDAGVP